MTICEWDNPDMSDWKYGFGAICRVMKMGEKDISIFPTMKSVKE